MAASKPLLFLSVLIVAALAVVPTAEAQLGGIIGGLLGLIKINGTLFCTVNGTVSGAGVTATPVFPNATIQVQCGTGNVISTAVTNSSGSFAMTLNPLQYVLSLLINNCKLVVTTPPSSCDSSLPANALLTSSMQLIGRTLTGLRSITYIGPSGFTLNN